MKPDIIILVTAAFVGLAPAQVSKPTEPAAPSKEELRAEGVKAPVTVRHPVYQRARIVAGERVTQLFRKLIFKVPATKISAEHEGKASLNGIFFDLDGIGYIWHGTEFIKQGGAASHSVQNGNVRILYDMLKFSLSTHPENPLEAIDLSLTRFEQVVGKDLEVDVDKLTAREKKNIGLK